MMSSNTSEARRLRPDRRKISKDQDISNHKYPCWDEQALHVDTNVQRKRSKDPDISNHKYTYWDKQPLHVDTNVQHKKKSKDHDISNHKYTWWDKQASVGTLTLDLSCSLHSWCSNRLGPTPYEVLMIMCQVWHTV
jgi:hypothetical protein